MTSQTNNKSINWNVCYSYIKLKIVYIEDKHYTVSSKYCVSVNSEMIKSELKPTCGSPDVPMVLNPALSQGVAEQDTHNSTSHLPELMVNWKSSLLMCFRNRFSDCSDVGLGCLSPAGHLTVSCLKCTPKPNTTKLTVSHPSAVFNSPAWCSAIWFSTF